MNRGPGGVAPAFASLRRGESLDPRLHSGKPSACGARAPKSNPRPALDAAAAYRFHFARLSRGAKEADRYAMHGRNAFAISSLFILISICLLLPGCSPRSANLSVQKQSDEAHRLGVAKRHFKQGKLEIAERELKNLLRVEPTNQQAYYYLNLILEAEFQERRREQETKDETNGLWYPTLPPRRVQ